MEEWKWKALFPTVSLLLFLWGPTQGTQENMLTMMGTPMGFAPDKSWCGQDPLPGTIDHVYWAMFARGRAPIGRPS